MSMNLMIQGTMSNVGKSIITAALCRIFKQDGYRVAPFKSQNMALNSAITPDGKEMGRAQVVQAQAAGIVPDVRMNPILLKPMKDTGSQVIVNGHPIGNYSASDYFRMKRDLIPDILKAYHELEQEYDIIVIEGAGSPVEINLKAEDIVNMGMAKMVDAPVVLVGDIDPGGVFAQLYGTTELLEEEEKSRLIGTVINKFRGDPGLLEPGVTMIEDLTGVPVLGVVPYQKLSIDDEDSMARVLNCKKTDKMFDVAVIRLPHISNFTDFDPLSVHPLMGVRYVESAEELGTPDLIILPGTKNTIEDLCWLRESGLESVILNRIDAGTLTLGVCGGYQMLGEMISDPCGIESGGEIRGLGKLPVRTVFDREKIQENVTGICASCGRETANVSGYLIHMGRSFKTREDAGDFCVLDGLGADGCVCKNVYGTYLHGLFDSGELILRFADLIAQQKGISVLEEEVVTHYEAQEKELDKLADAVRAALDLERIYDAMRSYEKRRRKENYATS